MAVEVGGFFTRDLSALPPAEATRMIMRRRFRSGDRQILNRQGRAICRALSASGRSATQIAGIIQASRTTVSKAIKNAYVIKDDVGEDHQYIGNVLDELDDSRTPFLGIRIDQQPPMSGVRTTVDDLDIVTDEQQEYPETLSNGGTPVVGHHRAGFGRLQSVGKPELPQSLTLPPALLPTQQCALTAYYQALYQKKTISPTVNHCGQTARGNDMFLFLACLEYDLSDWYFVFRAKGLGTLEELLAMAGREDIWVLDRMFAKLVPTMPDAHRWVLTEGVIALAKERG